MNNHTPIPIIDLFAGPGGLGEGFASVRDEASGKPVFDIRVSIEMTEVAHRTLELRATYRHLERSGKVPDIYFDYLRGECSRSDLIRHPDVADAYHHARQEAHCLELGYHPPEMIDEHIRRAVAGHSEWVLIGGPPCQAYSLAGRSRRKSDETFASDPKHFLYKEYLRIIEEHQPAVFVMENVRGLLSATHGGERMFDKIVADLSRPGYEIRSFVKDGNSDNLMPDEFLIRAEDFGLPQARHRVILLGIRKGLNGNLHRVLQKSSSRVWVEDVIDDLPAIRSRLSKEPDSFSSWISALAEVPGSIAELPETFRNDLTCVMADALGKAIDHKDTGGAFIRYQAKLPVKPYLSEISEWLLKDQNRLGGATLHETRSHIRADLHRYFYAACYAKIRTYSPKLSEFPAPLLPKHKNVHDERATPFEDRFRVQLARQPSTTVVSHISKDGHYYIHPYPSQARSLTVREAARLQTFPDNYFLKEHVPSSITKSGMPFLLSWHFSLVRLYGTIFGVLHQIDHSVGQGKHYCVSAITLAITMVLV